MKTTKIYQWLIVPFCLLAMSNVQVLASSENEKKKEEIKIVPIPISTGDVLTGSDQRSGIGIPFAAYYQGGVISISTSADFSSISINVENETTNQAWNTTTDISDGMGEISISAGGAGSYTVEIVTEYGECFVGSFIL